MKSDSEPQSQEPSAPSANAAAESRPAEASQNAPPSSVEPEASVEGPEAELARTKERLLRMAADFDNYRKRTRRDISDAERRVQENLLQVLVQPFDNLERAAAHADSAQDVKALAEGLRMVLRQFEDALSSVGIERIVSLGKPFDPAEHEAVQHVPTSEVPPGAVAQELRAGYRWQDRLIRPALVVVAKAPAAESSAPSSRADTEA